MQLGEGDMRRVLNLLQACSNSGTEEGGSSCGMQRRLVGRVVGISATDWQTRVSNACATRCLPRRQPPITHQLPQSVVMSAGEVSEGSAYTCAGRPLPAEIESAMHWFLNDPLTAAMESEFGVIGKEGGSARWGEGGGEGLGMPARQGWDSDGGR